MNVLIEECNFDALYKDGLRDYCKDNKIKYEFIQKYVDRRSPIAQDWVNIEATRNQNELWVPYGYIDFIENLPLSGSDGNPDNIIVWHNEKNLNWITYATYWNKYLLNKDFIITTYKQFKDNNRFYYDLFFETYNHENIFIRPCTNDKIFTGTAVSWYNYPNIIDKFGASEKIKIPDTQLIVISSYKEIKNEWRFIISDRKVITSSLYMNNDNFEEGCKNQKVLDLVEKICNDPWQPDEMYVLDMCENIWGDVFLLEIGSVHCAGWYACSVEKIVKEWQRKCDIIQKNWES